MWRRSFKENKTIKILAITRIMFKIALFCLPLTLRVTTSILNMAKKGEKRIRPLIVPN